MSLARAHRRLVIAMAALALTAFAAGAGVQPLTAGLAYLGLLVALVWSPSRETENRVARLWPPLAIVLAVRVGVVGLLERGDVVAPVVDLLLLLLVAEALRSEEEINDARLYALTLALILASTAYRPGALFALAFIGYVILATVAVPLGVVRRKAESLGAAAPRPGKGFLGMSLAVSAITLFTAGVVFLAFPRVTRGWAGQGEVMASTIAGFSDRVSIGDLGARIYSNPQVVLRVEFPGGRPDNLMGLHWRGRSYDRFDGTVWSRTRPDLIRPSRATPEWFQERWPAPWVRQDIYAAALDVRVIFGIGPIVQVEAESDIVPLRDMVGDWTYWGEALPVYRVLSKAGNPPAELLREAETGYMASRVHYLQLPRIPDRVAALADSLTRDEETRYDKVMAIQQYLRGEFGYTRELPATAREATLDHFLFQRREGHCEYFSTAMAVMLRSVGIHARNVSGFLGGRWNEFGGYLAVTQNEAHSWVEVWFPGYGWITFDPTPGGSGEGIGRSGWEWPGRFWFDGLQHRWNKWVLDYSMDAQIGFLESMRRWMEGDGPQGAEEGGSRSWVWILLAALSVAVFVALSRMAGPGSGPEGRAAAPSRGYRRLLREARRAGIVGTGPVGPQGLLRSIAEARPAAAAAAERAVEAYARTRFGGALLTTDQLREFRRDLRTARRAIRAGVETTSL